jgi:hypothetical protein
LLQPHLCDPSAPPPIDWFGCLDARKHWRKLGWWIAMFYTVGSVLFVIGGVAILIQSVRASHCRCPRICTPLHGHRMLGSARRETLCTTRRSVLQQPGGTTCRRVHWLCCSAA